MCSSLQFWPFKGWAFILFAIAITFDNISTFRCYNGRQIMPSQVSYDFKSDSLLTAWILRCRICHSVSDFICLFVTFENYRFWKYVGRNVCLFVCLFVCLLALSRPQFWTNRLDIVHMYWYDRILQAIRFWSKLGQGQGQGHKKVKNTFLAITLVLMKIETWNQRHFVPLLKAF